MPRGGETPAHAESTVESTVRPLLLCCMLARGPDNVSRPRWSSPSVGDLGQSRSGDARRGWLLAGAAGTYMIGVLGVTVGGNVPLNDALDAFDLAGSNDQAIDARRHSYETPWNRWHYLRTAANVGAFALTAVAALVAADAD